MAIDHDDAGGGRPSGGRRLPVRPLTGLLFVLLVAGSVALATVSSRVVDDQEGRLLERRAAEMAALLGQSGSQIQEALRVSATVANVTGFEDRPFTEVARPAVESGLFSGMTVVQADGDGYRVVLSEGIDAPRLPAADLDALLERAPAGGVFAASRPVPAGEGRRLGLASVVSGASPRTVVYAETDLPDRTGEPREASSPVFGDLEGAVYAGTGIDPAEIVITTAGFDPAAGRLHEQPLPFGAEEWTLAVRARSPLVGSLAARQPWLFLGGGLLAAVLVAALVEVLLRRRRFALALVDERTAQLQQSLADLDAAQERLVGQERLAAIGELASAVGHELRNPLGVLSNVFYLLGTRLGVDDPWVERQLRTGEREVAAATLIVSDLLQFARPREPIFGEVDVGDVVDEVLTVAPPPDGVELARRTPADVPAMRADRDQLRQVLLNLVTNAYDAMPDGGLLVVEAESAPEGVRLTVADTGAGMDDETRARLFEPFFTTKVKGIGLGLAVAGRIVTAHGGTITVKTRPSAGASFALTVPAAGVTAPSAR